ncbi:hypothetical protein QVD17_38001 [Tagetes erecta]|uniref:FAR1 domain-containing protein n=1 Tax=Tagetes erecta TaxID=13708 RepID=A0AAD8NJQ5_TARER|nr:hypothetical protein QVD17_38001 [Tagetes erecta]
MYSVSIYLLLLMPSQVDFEVDDVDVDVDVNGEVLVSSSVHVDHHDDDGVVGCSIIEGIFQVDHDIKIDQDDDVDDNDNDDDDDEQRGVDVAHSVNTSLLGEEPYVGKEFESEAAAHAFYNAYATRVGFVIRVSKLSRSRRDGTTIGRAFVCNKEGFRMPDKREKVVRQRAETRVGCRAMILVRKLTSGKWEVTKFVKEHTHPFTPGKGRRDLIYDQYPNGHDKIRELSQQLAIEKRRTATYKRHLEMIFEHIEEHNQSLSKKIKDIVDQVKEMESKEMQSHR